MKRKAPQGRKNERSSDLVVKFFKTGKPPVPAAETVELFAFMEAADESKRQGGKPVSIESVMGKAREEAKAHLGR